MRGASCAACPGQAKNLALCKDMTKDNLTSIMVRECEMALLTILWACLDSKGGSIDANHVARAGALCKAMSDACSDATFLPRDLAKALVSVHALIYCDTVSVEALDRQLVFLLEYMQLPASERLEGRGCGRRR